jgi:eukaryotic-like serine/threonine-protein kinase
VRGSDLDRVNGHYAFAVVRTRAEERDAQFSPDGKWIAYQSNEAGRFEIYVHAFPQPRDRSRISPNGGAQVRWRSDSKELFYIALDGQLTAVPIRLDSHAQTIVAGAPVPLFRSRIVGGAVMGLSRQQYVVSADGQRFLINTATEDVPPSPITLILNWKPEP